MRTLVACFALGTALAVPECLAAQTPRPHRASVQASKTTPRDRTRTAEPHARQLIRQRAGLRAQQRRARIELRKRLGISALRPTYGGD